MNRTLTAAVALALGLGAAGLAQAQTNGATPNPAMNRASPGMTQTPGMQNGANGGSYGTQPQANSPTDQTNAGMQQVSVSQAQIQQAQQELKAQGLYRGAVDGVAGPETQQAVMAFQRQHGLPQTAQLDQQTLDQLNSGGQQPGQQPPARSMTPPAGTQNPAAQTPPTATVPGGAANH